MVAKYAVLTNFLEAFPADKDVILDVSALGEMVGGLPPSAKTPAWWANTTSHAQALAWLTTGRRARFAGNRVVFSSARTALAAATRTPGTLAVLDGVAALDAMVKRAGYTSIVAAVAEHTVFLDPRTVAQTHNEALFPIIRDMIRRDTFAVLTDGRKVFLDDNTTPAWLFRCAAQRSRGRDVQYNHVWAESRDPDLYTALWNICATPAFLAKTSDGRNHPDVRQALQYRACELYGAHPQRQPPPPRPEDFAELQWAPMPEPVDDLEALLRYRLNKSPKSRPARVARNLGWLFSQGIPDPRIGGNAAADSPING